jgi:hypothetical protein
LTEIPPQRAPRDDVRQPVIPLDRKQQRRHQVNQPQEGKPPRRYPQAREQKHQDKRHPGTKIKKGQGNRPFPGQAKPLNKSRRFETYQGKAEINQRRQDGNALGIRAGGDDRGRLIVSRSIFYGGRSRFTVETYQVAICFGVFR